MPLKPPFRLKNVAQRLSQEAANYAQICTKSGRAPLYYPTGVALLPRLFLRNSCPIAPQKCDSKVHHAVPSN